MESTFETKGSTFISFLVGINQFESFVEQMRQMHPKAVHFVSATRYFNEQNQIEESFSDDGEPKGTSGMPTLKVLRGYCLVDCGILIVRYFGGTLLGTGGLVRAYTQGAKDVVLKAKENELLGIFIKKDSTTLLVEFSLFNKIEYLAKKLEIEIIKKSFLESGVELVLSAKKEHLKHFLEKYEQLKY